MINFFIFLSYLIRHKVVPVKRDSDSSGSKRKTSSTNLSKYDYKENIRNQFQFLFLDKRIIHIQQYKNHHDENMIILRHQLHLRHHQNPKDRVMIGRLIRKFNS